MKLVIAGWAIDIACDNDIIDYFPNFIPFKTTNTNFPVLCSIQTGCNILMTNTEPTQINLLEGRTLKLWLTPDRCIISLIYDGSTQNYFLSTDRHWQEIKTNWSSKTPDSLMALNDLIMLSFIYSSSFHNTVLIHASCIALNGDGCAFIGPSGIGKSTHSNLWLQYVTDSQLLNDDQPVLRLIPDGTVYMYGSPWSGQTPCFQNKRVNLKALFFMEQAKVNQLQRLGGIESFQKLLKSTSLIGRDSLTFGKISNTLAGILGIIPTFTLRNYPGKEAVELSYQTFLSL